MHTCAHATQALRRHSVHSIYATALTIPYLLGAEHLPLLITEDDVVFAPDANARLASVSRLPGCQLTPVRKRGPGEAAHGRRATGLCQGRAADVGSSHPLAPRRPLG